MTGPVSVALFIIPIDLSTLYIVTIIIKDDLQFPQRVSVARIKNIYTLYKFNFYSEPMFIHYEILLQRKFKVIVNVDIITNPFVEY